MSPHPTTLSPSVGRTTTARAAPDCFLRWEGQFAGRIRAASARTITVGQATRLVAAPSMVAVGRWAEADIEAEADESSPPT